jgi:hypothetical protein
MSERNARPLDKIADDIFKLERKSIFEIGDLLLEARAQCEHGEWMTWLEQFGWSWDTADRYAAVAELGSKFRKLRILKVPATILYDLVDRGDDIPVIIEELLKHATTKHLSSRDAQRVINIGTGRHYFGDYPDATLVQLAQLSNCQPWCQKAIAALKERKPGSDESARAIVDEIKQAHYAAEDVLEANVEREIETLLDGDPPELPPPTTPTDPEKLSLSADWAEARLFTVAVTHLGKLRAKPAAMFVGKFSRADLRNVAHFLIAIAEATKAEAA